jgi:recombination protein RecT
MKMSQLIDVNKVLISLKDSFTTQNNYGLKFESECLFAKQQITKNNFTFNIAQANQPSLKAAIMNVAAIGISLNPANAHAYLVPRDNAICLDISYRGLVKLATDSGAIKWAKAVLVYDGDTFKWLGPTTLPIHEADVFKKDRIDAVNPLNNLLGGYCIAKLATGEYMVEIMTADEIIQVRNTSKAKNGPWSGPWAGEMAKKTLVKRASKSWPQSSGRDRLDEAIQILNQHEGVQEVEQTSQETIEAFMECVASGNNMKLFTLLSKMSEEDQTACFNSAPKGEKVKLKDRVRIMTSEANQYINSYCDSIREYLESEDPALFELIEEITPEEWQFVSARLTDIEHRQIEQAKSGVIN